MSLRDDILGVEVFFKKKLVSFEGKEYLIKEPSLKTDFRILDLAKKSQDGSVDSLKYMIYQIIYCTYDPNTKKPLFSDEDYDVLATLPAKGLLSFLLNEIVLITQNDKKK